MHDPFATMRRLHERGPQSRGLAVDAEGVILGPDCILVRRTPAGYRSANPNEIARLTRSVLGDDGRLQRLPIVLAGITRALNAGDLVKAQLLGLEIPLVDLDDEQLARLRLAGDLLKDFDPNQPRDERGRWTSDGGEEENSAPALGSAVVAGTAASTLAPEIAPFMARVAAAFGAVGGAPALVLGAVLVPFSSFNRSNVSEGTLPDAPNIAYRYDEGVLTLSYRDSDGQTAQLFHGLSGIDGLYRDAEGNAIGRNLGDGQGFVLDPDALPALAAKVKAKDRFNQDKITAALLSFSQAAARSEPRLCPDPSADPGGISSVRAGMYQWQVCGIPPGFGILFNGARYDGCEIPTGTLLECKGPGFADKMFGSPADVWPWEDWFSREDKGMKKITEQLRKENDAAGNRLVILHAAEASVAEWFRNYVRANNLDRIVVVHTPALPFDPEMLRRMAVNFIGAWAWGTPS
jgi:hypothetical protein